MAMIADALSDVGVPVIVDRHADKRGRSIPTSVTVEHLGDGLHTNLLARAVEIGAAVFVDAHARVFVLSQGGGGKVAVAGTNSTPEQVATTTAVLDRLHALWGISVKAPTRKRKATVVKPAPEPEVVEVADEYVVLPSDWYPEEVTDEQRGS